MPRKMDKDVYSWGSNKIKRLRRESFKEYEVEDEFGNGREGGGDCSRRYSDLDRECSYPNRAREIPYAQIGRKMHYPNRGRENSYSQHGRETPYSHLYPGKSSTCSSEQSAGIYRRSSHWYNKRYVSPSEAYENESKFNKSKRRRSHSGFYEKPWWRDFCFLPHGISAVEMSLLVLVFFACISYPSFQLWSYLSEDPATDYVKLKLQKYEKGINLMSSAEGLYQQNPAIWNKLKFIGKLLLVKNSAQPVVLPVLLSQDSLDIGDCFVKLFQKVICDVFPCKQPWVLDYITDSDLYGHMTRALDGGTVWVMKHFEMIKSSDADQLLSNLGYKRGVIVIMIRTKESLKKLSQGDMDEHVERELETILQGKVQDGEISDIVSRLSSYGIVLTNDRRYETHGCPRIRLN